MGKQAVQCELLKASLQDKSELKTTGLLERSIYQVVSFNNSICFKKASKYKSTGFQRPLPQYWGRGLEANTNLMVLKRKLYGYHHPSWGWEERRRR